jgi:hypothetical protein
MKLLVVNPNTSASMTARIGAAAAAGTDIVAVNPESGPASIEGSVRRAQRHWRCEPRCRPLKPRTGWNGAHKPVTSSSRRAAPRSKL